MTEPSDEAFIKTLLFSMERILAESDRDEVMVSATRFGRLISGIPNGSRNTLPKLEIRVYVYYLELIRRNWPLTSEWICQEVTPSNFHALVFRRRKG
jgi:hypothetical protein